jgi:hypothetical protein
MAGQPLPCWTPRLGAWTVPQNGAKPNPSVVHLRALICRGRTPGNHRRLPLPASQHVVVALATPFALIDGATNGSANARGHTFAVTHLYTDAFAKTQN